MTGVTYIQLEVFSDKDLNYFTCSKQDVECFSPRNKKDIEGFKKRYSTAI